MMSTLISGFSSLHVLHILHRDVFSVLLVGVVCHSFWCLLRQQQEIMYQVEYVNRSK